MKSSPASSHGSIRGSGKQLTRQYPRVDIRHLSRAGVLEVLEPSVSRRWGSPGSLSLAITAKRENGSLRLVFVLGFGRLPPGTGQSVAVSRTKCHFGGERAWFLCPTPNCGRRVATLYITTSLACRTCLKLAYASTRQSVLERVSTRAARLRERLGWNRRLEPGWDVKPPRMRWSTFLRLVAEHERCMAISLNALRASLPPLNPGKF